jgi:hypothetical protein
MTGIAKKTVMRVLVEVGEVCALYQDQVFRNLRCKRLQLDELRSWIFAKRRTAPKKSLAVTAAVNRCATQRQGQTPGEPLRHLKSSTTLDPSSLRMRVFWVALLGCFQAQHQDVEDDADVDGDDQKANPVGVAQQIGHLERNVDGARGNRHPLRPGAEVPEPVGLDEAKGGVDRCCQGELPQANVADPVDQVDKDSNEVVMGVGVNKLQEALGHSPDVLVAHGEDTETGENYDEPLQELNGGDGAHAFDVSGILDFELRD